MILMLFLHRAPISIIVPVYNGESVIQTAIKSVHKQNPQLTELIIINDGSTDKTDNAIQGYFRSQQWIKRTEFQNDETNQIKNDDQIVQQSDIASHVTTYFEHQQHSFPSLIYITLLHNRGPLYARMLGTALASDYISFLDADDELVPGILQTAYIKQKETQSDVVFFASNITEMHNKQKQKPLTFPLIIDKLMYSLSGNDVIMKFIHSHFYQVWGNLMKTDKQQETMRRLNILAVNRIIAVEDTLEVGAFILANYSIIGLGDVGYIYYVNDNQVTLQVGAYKSNLQIYNQRIRVLLVAKYYFHFMDQTVIKDIRQPANSMSYQDVVRNEDCEYQIDILKHQKDVMSGPEYYSNAIFNLLDDKEFIQKCYRNQFQNDWRKYKNNISKVPELVEYYNGMNIDDIFRQNYTINQTINLINKIFTDVVNNPQRIEQSPKTKIQKSTESLLFIPTCESFQYTAKQIKDIVNLFAEQKIDNSKTIISCSYVCENLKWIFQDTNGQVQIVEDRQMDKVVQRIQSAQDVYYLNNSCFFSSDLYFLMNDVDMGDWMIVDE